NGYPRSRLSRRGQFPGLPFRAPLPTLTAMPSALADRVVVTADTAGVSTDTAVADSRVTAAGEAALAQAQALARRAATPATLRAYKADWTHYAAWCAQAGFVPVPAAPATVGAYLASLGETHAPTTIRRRLSAIGKMHRFNDLPWNPAHRDIQEPLRGLLRQHGRPPQKAAPLTLPMLRRLLATCDPSARGRRDRALLLFGFAGALRRSELAALRVDDVGVSAGGLRLRTARAFEAWQAVARRKAGPLFRRVSSAGRIGGAELHPDAGDPGAARRHGGARARGVRAAERACAAHRLHHRG